MHKILFLTALAVLALTSCDDETGSLGLSDTTDEISNTTDVFDVTSRSLLMDSVKATSSRSYLGSVVDPETGYRITADFASQFYCFEDYTFPPLAQMVAGVELNDQGDTLAIERGRAVCDSIELRLYFDTRMGDTDNPMKLQVYELDPEHILSEDSIYYTDVDLSEYVPSGARPLAERVITPRDYNLSESEQTSSTHSDNVHITLPRALGQLIMDRYYADASTFKDAYHFIRRVFPGLYFRVVGGEGTMLGVYVSTLNVYFSYTEDATSRRVHSGLSRFTATPEVIQSTRFTGSSSVIQRLASDPTCTYLKTPAGIATELTLPVSEIFQREHAGDSVSRAQVTLTRYNKTQTANPFGTPQTLLMVRKADARGFFLEGRVADSRTSFTTTFNPIYNTYTFTNIARLISYIRHEQDADIRRRIEARGGKATKENIEAERAAWELDNPDWNRVVLYPVETSYSSTSSSSYYGYTSSSSDKLTSVRHDLGLNSIRLVGEQTPIKMQVVYSKFE